MADSPDSKNGNNDPDKWTSPAEELNSLEGGSRSNDGFDDPDLASKNSVEETSKNLDDKESSPKSGWKNNFTGRQPGPAAVGGYSLKSWMRKKGVIGAIIALVIGGGALTIFPAMAPFAMLYNVTNDLNDHLAGLDIRENHIFRNKIRAGVVANDTVAGCTTLSIRCKLKTISTAELRRLERVGFNIEVDPNSRSLPGRVVPVSYEFRGQTIGDGQAMLQAIRENPTLRAAHMRANNMQSIGYMSKTFMDRVYKRFGLSKAARPLSGSPQDRLNQLLTSARTQSFSDVRWVPVEGSDDRWTAVNPQGDTVVDSEGNPREFTQKERTFLESQARREGGEGRPGSRVPGGKVAIGGVSALAVADLTCTMYDMVGAAIMGAKVAVLAETLEYSLNLSAQIGKIQAGDASPEDAEAIGKLLNDTDNRRQVVDLTESVANAQSSGSDDNVLGDEEIDEVMKDNPYYGKSFLDAALINMSINGGKAAGNAAASRFSLGGGPATLLRGVDGVHQIIGTLTAEKTNCGFIQHPLTRGAGLIASIIMGFGSLGSSVIWQAGQVTVMVSAMVGLNYFLNTILSDSVIDQLGEEPDDKEAAASAYWTGKAGANSLASQAYGLSPASAGEMVQNQSLRDETILAYSKMEAENLNPLDATDPRTTLGSLVNGFHRTVGPKPSLTSIASAMPRTIFSAIFPSVSAATDAAERFKQCDDPELESIGFDADVQCNIRYWLPPESHNLDPEVVAQWMEDNNYVEKDTTTGFPAGYTPVDPTEQENFLSELVRGATIGQFAARRASVLQGEGNREYAYFLEYCVYRVLPYGDPFEENLPGDAPEEWRTGEKCRDRGEMMAYFRAYTLDIRIEEGLSEEVSVGTVTRQNPGGPGSGRVGDLSDPNQECAPGTESLGTIKTRYVGQHVSGGEPRPTIALCRLSSITGFGQNASGNLEREGAVVNAAVSGVFQEIGNQLKAAGMDPVSNSSFRLRQPCDATGNGLCAPDGWSEHQIGAAIDFAIPGDGFRQGATCSSGRSRSNDKIFTWLEENSGIYGVKQYAPEHWHWEFVVPGSSDSAKCP